MLFNTCICAQIVPSVAARFHIWKDQPISADHDGVDIGVLRFSTGQAQHRRCQVGRTKRSAMRTLGPCSCGPRC